MDPIHEDESGYLTVVGGPNIPNEKFSIGVAMSENGVFAVNAQPNVTTCIILCTKRILRTHYVLSIVVDFADIK